MDRSMFCICDLSASAYAQQILAHIPQTRQAVLLDIGKNTALPKSEVLGEWSILYNYHLYSLKDIY